MSLFDLFILAVGLSMDAMAVAVCKGLSVQKLKFRHALITGLYFGGFQAAMPLLGYLLGIRFQAYIESVDHWIAFILLGVIGANMIKESFGEAEEVNCSFCPRAMLPMAVATSIDALAVGVTFAFLGVDIVPAVSFIGVITFTLSAAGVYIGHLFGAKFKSKAERTGGIVLVLMGLRILLEHLGVIEWFLGLFS
jgi:putative Mn2+ efflux pump MntP